MMSAAAAGGTPNLRTKQRRSARKDDKLMRFNRTFGPGAGALAMAQACSKQESDGYCAPGSPGSMCLHCAFIVTGIIPYFCCKKCEKSPGEHGPHCQRILWAARPPPRRRFEPQADLLPPSPPPVPRAPRGPPLTVRPVFANARTPAPEFPSVSASLPSSSPSEDTPVPEPAPASAPAPEHAAVPTPASAPKPKPSAPNASRLTTTSTPPAAASPPSAPEPTMAFLSSASGIAPQPPHDPPPSSPRPFRPVAASTQRTQPNLSATIRKLIADLAPDAREKLDELEWRRLVEAEDLARFGANETGSEAAAELSAELGVTAKWLVEFTETHGCWEWPTWQVVERVVRPSTAATRCRYLELPEMQSATCEAGGRTLPVVGPASIYVSHAWGACWGTLVSALLKDTSETRRVWLDVFAVRQYPGNEADANFAAVIARCSALILVCEGLPFGDDGQGGLLVHGLTAAQSSRIDLLPESARARVALLRAWCLAEVNAAIVAGKPTALKCGAMDTSRNFVSNASAAIALSPLISIEQAQAARQHELEALREMASGELGGQLNRRVRSLIAGSSLCRGLPHVVAAAFGDGEWLAGIQSLGAPSGSAMSGRLLKWAVGAAGGGYLTLLERIIEAEYRQHGAVTLPTSRIPNEATATALAPSLEPAGHAGREGVVPAATSTVGPKSTEGWQTGVHARAVSVQPAGAAATEEGARVGSEGRLVRLEMLRKTNMEAREELQPLPTPEVAGGEAEAQSVESGETTEEAEVLVGMSPLLAAAASGQLEALHFLLECVETAKRRDAVNQTIGTVRLTSFDGVGPSVSRKLHSSLLPLISTCHCLQGAGTTALMFAAAGGFDEVCALLIAHGAAVAVLDEQQPVAVDALQRAVTGGHTSCVRILLENGGDADHRNARGQTYLLYALLFGHIDTARLLVEKGCEVNAQFTAWGQPGMTVLMVAAVRGAEEAVEFCLARLSATEARRRDHNGATAADWAGRGRHFELKQRIEYVAKADR